MIQSFLTWYDWIPRNEWHSKSRLCAHDSHLISFKSGICDLCRGCTIAYVLADEQGKLIEINNKARRKIYFLFCIYCSLSIYVNENDCDCDFNEFIGDNYRYNHHYRLGWDAKISWGNNCVYVPESYCNAIYGTDLFVGANKFSLNAICDESGDNITGDNNISGNSVTGNNTKKKIELKYYTCQLCGERDENYILIDFDGCDRTYCTHFSKDWLVICERCSIFNGRKRGVKYYELKDKCDCTEKHKPKKILEKLVTFICSCREV